MSSDNWQEKFKDNLLKYLGEESKNRVLADEKNMNSLDETNKAAYCHNLMSRLDKETSDEELKIELMSGCSCRCYEDHLTYLKKVYSETQDIDKLLQAMHETVFRVKPERSGNKIVITKGPHFPDEHSKAETAEEKRYYFCHCDNVRSLAKDPLTKPISMTYCYCGAGWCKNIWENVLGRKVKIEITKSVLHADDVCQFAVYI